MQTTKKWKFQGAKNSKMSQLKKWHIQEVIKWSSSLGFFYLHVLIHTKIVLKKGKTVQYFSNNLAAQEQLKKNLQIKQCAVSAVNVAFNSF